MKVSFIFGTRNDGYGGNYAVWRRSLLGTIESIRRLNPHEIIIGEWNPPKCRPSLLSVLAEANMVERVITFKPELQEKLDCDRVGYPGMMFYEFIIKHYCAKYIATGDAVVFTNADDVFLSGNWGNVLNGLESGEAVTGVRYDARFEHMPPLDQPDAYVKKVENGIKSGAIKYVPNVGPYGDFTAMVRDKYIQNPYRLYHKNEFCDVELINSFASYVKSDYATVHFMHQSTAGTGKPGRPYGDHLENPPQPISQSILDDITTKYMVI